MQPTAVESQRLTNLGQPPSQATGYRRTESIPLSTAKHTVRDDVAGYDFKAVQAWWKERLGEPTAASEGGPIETDSASGQVEEDPLRYSLNAPTRRRFWKRLQKRRPVS